MDISPRRGVALSCLVFAKATVSTLGLATPASAYTVSMGPQRSVAGYSVIDKDQHWRNGGHAHDSWY
jgi:hypothetical protein